MTTAYKFQDPGEGIHEGEIREVVVAPGDTVEEGDTVLVVETDKAAIELPAPNDGTIEEIMVKPGDTVRVGDVLMTFVDSAGEIGEEKPEKAAEAEAEQEKQKKAAKPARKEGAGPVPATPATRRLARELGVDLAAVSGSGADGRVTKEDVRAHAEGGRRARREEEHAALPDFAEWGDISRTPVRSIRRATARHMATAWAQIPHVVHQDDVDITDLERTRRHQQAELSEEDPDARLTLTVYLMKAIVAGLKEHPRFNASYDPDADEIVLKHYFHIGIATDSDQGLLVPVVRDVDRKSPFELARELPDLTRRAREGKASRGEMRGGTFTLTNVGPLGGTHFSPIVNHPEVAILGAGHARLRPVIEGTLDDWQVVPRLILPLSLAFDHRINDGADAARFMHTVMSVLRDPEHLMLKG